MRSSAPGRWRAVRARWSTRWPRDRSGEPSHFKRLRAIGTVVPKKSTTTRQMHEERPCRQYGCFESWIDPYAAADSGPLETVGQRQTGLARSRNEHSKANGNQQRAYQRDRRSTGPPSASMLVEGVTTLEASRGHSPGTTSTRWRKWRRRSSRCRKPAAGNAAAHDPGHLRQGMKQPSRVHTGTLCHHGALRHRHHDVAKQLSAKVKGWPLQLLARKRRRARFATSMGKNQKAEIKATPISWRRPRKSPIPRCRRRRAVVTGRPRRTPPGEPLAPTAARGPLCFAERLSTRRTAAMANARSSRVVSSPSEKRTADRARASPTIARI